MTTAAKNFDEARAARQAQAKTFQIGGETFQMSAGVHPDSIAEFDQIGDDTNITQTLAIVDGVISSMISDADDGHARYAALRARKSDPLTISDLLELAEWLIGEQTERTPTPLSGSSGGQERTETTLMDVSSSPVTPE